MKSIKTTIREWHLLRLIKHGQAYYEEIEKLANEYGHGLAGGIELNYHGLIITIKREGGQ